MSEPLRCKDGSILNENYEEQMTAYVEEKLEPASSLVLDCISSNEILIDPAPQIAKEPILSVDESIIYDVVNGSFIHSDLNFQIPFNGVFSIHATSYEEWLKTGNVNVRWTRREPGSEHPISDTFPATPASLSYSFGQQGGVLYMQVRLDYPNTQAPIKHNEFRSNIPSALVPKMAEAHNAITFTQPGEEIPSRGPKRLDSILAEDLKSLKGEERHSYLVGAVETLSQCREAINAYLELWSNRPKLCISEEELTPQPTPAPAPPEPPKAPEPDPCVYPEQEKWGVRFRYRVGPNANACIPNQAPREALAAGTTSNTPLTSTTSYEERDWFLTLLPAMKSVFPGNMDVPGAMPGLQFRVFSNIAKHRVPGFQPIYQHLGVESTYITMVGTFTGDGGLGHIRKVTETTGNILESETRQLRGAPNYNTGDFDTDTQAIDNEEIGQYTDEGSRLSIVEGNSSRYITNGEITIWNAEPASGGEPYLLAAGETIQLTGRTSTNEDGSRYHEVQGGHWINARLLRHDTSNISQDIDSRVIEDEIEENYNNYSLHKVVVDRAEVWDKYPSGRRAAPIYNTFIRRGETVLITEVKGDWSLTTQNYWISNSHIRQITNTNLDVPVARNQEDIVPSTYKDGALFLADACMVECPMEGAEDGYSTLNEWHNQFYNPNPKIEPHRNSNTKAVWEIAQALDSYHEFVSFYKLAVQQGNELEVEINVRKSQDGLKPIQGLIDDPLRNRENGNPKFKGFLRKMEVYAARTDRTWYLMEFEVTDHALAGYQPINLTHDLNASIAEALKQQQETLEEEELTEEQIEANDMANLIRVYTQDGQSYNVLIPGARKVSRGRTRSRNRVTGGTINVPIPSLPGSTKYYIEYEELSIEVEKELYDSIRESSTTKVGGEEKIRVTGKKPQLLTREEFEALPPYGGFIPPEISTNQEEEQASPIPRRRIHKGARIAGRNRGVIPPETSTNEEEEQASPITNNHRGGRRAAGRRGINRP